ncbi:hypothetical protein EJB05_07860, partial [Eragrostis curvula]
MTRQIDLNTRRGQRRGQNFCTSFISRAHAIKIHLSIAKVAIWARARTDDDDGATAFGALSSAPDSPAFEIPPTSSQPLILASRLASCLIASNSIVQDELQVRGAAGHRPHRSMIPITYLQDVSVNHIATNFSIHHGVRSGIVLRIEAMSAVSCAREQLNWMENFAWTSLEIYAFGRVPHHVRMGEL